MSIQKAIDVSSHQPRDLSALIEHHQPQHVIVKLYMPWEVIPWEHTAAQVQSARENGCTVGGYVWGYRTASPTKTIDAVIARCASIDLVLPLLWIDCETYNDPTTGAVADPGPDAEWLRTAIDHAWTVYGMPCGIYTGRWWVVDHFPGGSEAFKEFTKFPIWLSYYDRLPNIDVFLPFSGLESIAAKQYTSEPVDLNVIRAEYTVYEPPVVDPCALLRDSLVALRDRRPYKAITKRQLVELLA